MPDTTAKNWDAQQIRRGASFLQSLEWANFQAAVGSKPHFLQSEDWTCLLLERKTPFGRYLFAPYGPTLKQPEALPGALKNLKQYASQNGFDWLTIEPMVPDGDSQLIRSSLPKLGALKSDHNREPDLTRIIDLKPAEADLLSAISQSTRSFIRKNQRENFLKFKSSINPDDITIFIHMLGQVTSRKNVQFFSDNYFKKQAELLMPAGMLHLELALAGDKPVASALFHDFGSLSTYSFAGSLAEARQTNASAVLLWQAILNAKSRGIKSMDLYGIAPDESAASHPWAGFTAFKQKFGGKVISHAGTWDIALSSRYRLNRGAKKARQLLRRR